MNELNDFFWRSVVTIPDVVWSGVISAIVASGISLLTVRATNRSSSERLRIQHQFDLSEAAKQREVDLSEAESQRVHDALQKAQDRKSAIRREVYIEAVESVHKLLGYFANLPDVSQNKIDEIGPFQDFLAANSKVWLVAESEASHVSREFASQVGEALFAMMQAAQPLRTKLEPMHIIDKDISNAQNELIKIQSKLILSAGSDEEKIQVKQSFERANDWVKELLNRKNKLEEGIGEMRLAYASQSMELLEPIQATLVRLVSALRAELDLAPDLDIFMNQYEDQKQRMKNVLVKLNQE